MLRKTKIYILKHYYNSSEKIHILLSSSYSNNESCIKLWFKSHNKYLKNRENDNFLNYNSFIIC